MKADSTCRSPYRSSRSSTFLGLIAASAMAAAVAMFSTAPVHASALSLDPGAAERGRPQWWI
jgi:hypothetical protein